MSETLDKAEAVGKEIENKIFLSRPGLRHTNEAEAIGREIEGRLILRSPTSHINNISRPPMHHVVTPRAASTLCSGISTQRA